MLNWSNTQHIMPEEERALFLSKEPVDDLLKTDLGRLVKSDEGQMGWFIGNEVRILKVEARTFWAYVEERDIAIGPVTSDEELAPVVSDLLKKLALFEKKFQRLALGMITSGKGTYHLDYYISGILNRSLSLLYGFETLLNSLNFISAAHLVRPYLDSYLRLYAAWLVKDPHDFARQVWEGVPIRKIKDEDNKPLTDAYLKEKAALDYPWMEDVYNETSGFIHFSNKHIANATQLGEQGEEYTFNTYIGKVDNGVTNLSKVEAVGCMIEISNCIAKAVYGWIETKRIRG